MSLPSAKPIAFNRRLRAAWLREGLRLLSDGCAEKPWLERMEDLVRETNSGKDSIQKSMRYLRHVWIEPGPLEKLRAGAIQLHRSCRTEGASRILSWGMAMATYPFLNEVAAAVGRMLHVQPEVKLEQILRKLAETHGERETVRRSTRYALAVIVDFGFVVHAETAGCYLLAPPLKPDAPEISAWLVRAWFAATGAPEVMDRMVLTATPSLQFFNAAMLIQQAIETGALMPERMSFSQEVLRLVESFET